MGELPESKLPTTSEHNTSMERFVPIVLQYFQAVDTISTNVKPDNKGYLNIQLYTGKDQPDLIILRLVSKYKDGNIGIQDELALPTRKDRLQLNAEKNPQGEYLQYPAPLTPGGLKYLQEIIRIFSDSVAREGSKIVINNKTEFVAREGVWLRHQVHQGKMGSKVLTTSQTTPLEYSSQ